MNKTTSFIAIVLLSIIIAGFYGILHDQLTYTISPEYFTKYKFIQFGLIDETGDNAQLSPRLMVAMAGFMATWWMGPPIGIILALTGLTLKDGNLMFRITMKAISLSVIIAFLTGLLGLVYGKLFLSENPIEYYDNWNLPSGLVDYKNFVSTGSMHNFSYFGGLTGLIAGVIYIIHKKNIKSA